jgi:XTP/dITP diphosphohydrolase
MSMSILLASNNTKKVAELSRILAPLIADLEVLGLADVAAYGEPAETEPTFEGNALIKARAALAHSGLPSLADDSGLCVDALHEMPGVLSARWAGVAKSAGADEANNRLVLAQLADVPTERRTARFRCAAALCLPDGREIVRTGVMEGEILPAPRGSGGFGYDPLFRAAGQNVSNAELSPEVKDAISHRGRALRAIAADIAEALYKS